MTRYLFTTMLIGGMLFAGTVQGDIILFQDGFDGQAGVPLDGTTPDVTQGTTTWATNLWRASGDPPLSGDGYRADGTVDGTKRNAYLTLGNLINDNRGNPDAIYTLSATLDVPEFSGSTSWEAIGFWPDADPGEKQFTTSSSGVAWMLRRENQEIRVFSGPGTGGSLTVSGSSPNNVAGEVDLQVVLDLTTWDGSSDYGTVTYYGKLSTDATYTQLATGALVANNSSFGSVGLSGGETAAVTVSFFELSQVPEPATMTMLVFGGLMALLRRRRR